MFARASIRKQIYPNVSLALGQVASLDLLYRKGSCVSGTHVSLRDFRIHESRGIVYHLQLMLEGCIHANDCTQLLSQLHPLHLKDLYLQPISYKGVIFWQKIDAAVLNPGF